MQPVLILGHTGFLGKAVVRIMNERGLNFVGASLSSGFDLRVPNSLNTLIKSLNPKAIVNCAAVVGGIEYGRTHGASMFRDNMLMQLEVLESASMNGIKVVNPISNCIYPKKLTHFKEDELWDGPLDETVLVYGGVRKIGIVGSQAYASERKLDVVNLIFPNLYGPGDHLDPIRAHALGGLVYKFVEAKEKGTDVVIWGTGKPIREWLYVDDAAEALISAINLDISPDPLNIGTGIGISISELAHLIATQLGYSGKIHYDFFKADGALTKTMNATKSDLFFESMKFTDFTLGLIKTINYYQQEMH
jgi:GDP-L-fucose synthase